MTNEEFVAVMGLLGLHLVQEPSHRMQGGYYAGVGLVSPEGPRVYNCHASTAEAALTGTRERWEAYNL